MKMSTKEKSTKGGDGALAVEDELAAVDVGVECAPGDLQSQPVPWYKQYQRLLIAAVLLIVAGVAVALGVVLGGDEEEGPVAQCSPGSTFPNQSLAVDLFPNERFAALDILRIEGESVAIDKDTAVVGAPLNMDRRGEVYVFTRDVNGEWSEQDRLALPDEIDPIRKDGYTAFGSAVAISDDVIIVGAPADFKWDFEYGEYGVSRAAAYIFVREGNKWSYKDRLATNEAVLDLFGFSVASHGESIVVGAPWEEVHAEKDGSVHVFAQKGAHWMKQTKLLASDVYEFFGGSVDIHGDLLVVSTSAEEVHVFARKGAEWVPEALLLAPEEDHGFGLAVGVSEDLIVVGASGDDDDGGSAYVFARDKGNWTRKAKLTAPGEVVAVGFGRSVAIDCGVIIVGAGGYDLLDRQSDDSGAYGGSAYVFACNGSEWAHQATLVSPKGVDGDDFGRSVSISCGTVLVGSADGAYIFPG
ncbi:hypothetical protein ACHAXT_003397 [Thalassiosira profunda]